VFVEPRHTYLFLGVEKRTTTPGHDHDERTPPTDFRDYFLYLFVLFWERKRWGLTDKRRRNGNGRKERYIWLTDGCGYGFYGELNPELLSRLMTDGETHETRFFLQRKGMVWIMGHGPDRKGGGIDRQRG
jgi:hypothetical protein